MRKLGVALLGLGPWGKNLVAAARQVTDLTLCGAFDPRYSATNPGVRDLHHFASEQELLAHPRTEAVLIATPPATHAELALRSLGAGHWTFVDKPLAMASQDALRLSAASCGRLMVGHLLAYHPVLETLSRILTECQLGGARSMTSTRQSLARDHAPCAWWNLGVHDVYLALRWFGWPERLRVIPGEPLRAEIRWSSGEFATFVLSAQGRHKRREVLLEGTGGVVCFDDVKTPRLSGSGALFTSLGSAEIGSEEPLVLELKHFVSCIIQGRAFRTDVAEGVQVVRLLELGQRSLDSSGSWVAATMPGGHANDCAAP